MHISSALLVLATTATASNVARHGLEARQTTPTATPTSSLGNCGQLTSLWDNAPTQPPELASYLSSLRAQMSFTDQCDISSYSRSSLSITPPAALATVFSAYVSSVSSFESWVRATRASLTAECPIYTMSNSVEDMCARGERFPINPPAPWPTTWSRAAVNGTTSGGAGSPTSSVVPAGAASNVVAAGVAAVAFIGAVAAL